MTQIENYFLLCIFLTSLLCFFGLSAFIYEVLKFIKEYFENRKVHYDAWKKDTIVETVKSVKK